MTRKNRGSALLATFAVLSLVSLAALAFIDRSTVRVRLARRQAYEIRTTNLCEAGVQSLLMNLWRPFKSGQKFATLDATCANASAASPKASISGTITSVGNYSAGITMIQTPSTDSYTRILRIRAVGWIDLDGDGVIDNNEPMKIIDATVSFSLQRSRVFDYAYFVNNYGWMSGFDENSLIVNGDMRANGNFDFTSGTPTVNGSVIACNNEKLSPAVAGLVNMAPVKWSNSTYLSNVAANPTGYADYQARCRPGYNSSTMGAKGSTTYDSWSDYVFDSDGGLSNGNIVGAVIGDSTGFDAWTKGSGSSSTASTLVDATPTSELTMPDLSDLTVYQAMSNSWTGNGGNGDPTKATGQTASIQVWNTSTNAYQTLSTSGVVTGSATLVGTDTHPIKINGPVTVTQDIVIKGTVSGQGTLYAGRNVHIVGSIKYKTKPDFRGTNSSTYMTQNQAADMLGLAARASVMMGDVSQYTSTVLQYMTPPFTKGRYTDTGVWVPPFDANAIDSTGNKTYKALVGDTAIHNLAESVDQIDAVMYTNFVGGGTLGTGGGGTILNGSIISRDEAMVIYSLPMKINYDPRIHERSLTAAPQIDVALPRSPRLRRLGWKDQGFSHGPF